MEPRAANKPAAGKAGIRSVLAIECHWPGLPEPERWASPHFMKNFALLLSTALLAIVFAGCSEHTSPTTPPSTIAGHEASLESLTNTVRTVTPAPIVSLNKRDKEGTRYLVTTDSPVEQREFALTWSGSSWKVEPLSVIPKH